MADLEKMKCGNIQSNTGDNRCKIELELLETYIRIPEGKVYTTTETADGDAFMAALQADLYNPIKSLRAYIFKGAASVAQGVTEATSETSEYGKVRSRLDMQVNLTYTFWNKGQCWYSATIPFNRDSSGRYILIGKDGTIVSQIVRDSSGTIIGRTGFQMCDVLINAPTMATGSAGVMQTHRLTFNDYQNDYGLNASYIQSSNASKDLYGLQDFYLKNITSLITPTPPTGTYYVQVLSSCGGTDIAAQFQTLFTSETQGHPWISYNNTDGSGSVVAITSATYVATPYVGADAGAIALAFTTGSGGWTAGEDVHLEVAATNVLNTDGMVGFEANPNYIVLPN